MKKNIKNTEEKTYKSGEVMSMLEQINDGIKIVSEQYGDVTNRLNSIDVRLDKIDVRLDSIDARLDKIEGDIEVIKSDIIDIKYDLKEKVSYVDFEKMEKRMVKLEKLVFAKLG
jgi:chromosome segregation ATPase